MTENAQTGTNSEGDTAGRVQVRAVNGVRVLLNDVEIAAIPCIDIHADLEPPTHEKNGLFVLAFQMEDPWTTLGLVHVIGKISNQIEGPDRLGAVDERHLTRFGQNGGALSTSPHIRALVGSCRA